jgi:hypothetical protein
MDSISTSYGQHAFAFWLALVVVAVLLGIWTFAIHVRSRRLESRLNGLFAGMEDENTTRMLVEYLGIVRSTAATVNRIKAEHDQLAAMMPSVVRHVGLVRFSPFHDTGGDQSFALALLDGRGDGVVVTGLHSRTESRLYAKPIEAGTSRYSLTPEEREAMDRALHRVSVASASS